MQIPFAIPECRIKRVIEQNPDRLVISMRRRGASGRCPDCGDTSQSVHSRYHRHPADLPLSASRTVLRIEVRRFYCLNPSCHRRTFAESPSELHSPRARCTRRLAEAQGRIGIACGGRGRRSFADAPENAGQPRNRAAVH
ncbi:transposase family protein [Methylobacterium brachiatum]|uniref:Transposase family protein n=1 Tax=Methylobacterium brachiatum TaxID=269660 RepID=A0ABV1R8E3_9HYPH